MGISVDLFADKLDTTAIDGLHHRNQIRTGPAPVVAGVINIGVDL